MLARLATEADHIRVDDFLNGDWGDFKPDRDSLVVCEAGNKITGVLMMRSMPFVHEFTVAPNVARYAATALLNYAAGIARANGHREAAFIVDQTNERMARWVKEHGAVKQGPGELYTMEVR